MKLMLRYQVGKELPQEDVDDIVAFLHSLNGVYTPYMQDKQYNLIARTGVFGRFLLR